MKQLKARYIKLRRISVNDGGKPYWTLDLLWPDSGPGKIELDCYDCAIFYFDGVPYWAFNIVWPNSNPFRAVFDCYDSAIFYLRLLELGGAI